MTRHTRRSEPRPAAPSSPPEDVGWQEQAAEVIGQGGALAVMQGGAAIVRAENEALIEYAIRHPRDPMRAIAKAMAELEIDPEFASKQWYSIPYRVYGEVGAQVLCACDGARPGHPKEAHTLIEGVSIKGALACGRAWGNCGVKALLIDETDDKFVVEGLAVDRETLFTVSRVGAVSKFIKRRGTGAMEKISSEKYPQLIQSAASKQARNALLAIMPEPLVRRYWSKARELAARVEAEQMRQPANKRPAGPMASFAPWLDPRPKDAPEGWTHDWKKVRAYLEAFLRCPLQEANPEELAHLRGVLNALESGEAKVADYFPGAGTAVGSEPTEVPAPPKGGPSDPLKGRVV